MIAVYVPTYGRPQAPQRLADNLLAATETPHRLVFICDREQDLNSCLGTGQTALRNTGRGYSDAIQTAFQADNCRYFIAANDDFDFQPGWDRAALQVLDSPDVDVVALNDGSPSPFKFRTIALVRRSYIELQSGVIDMPGRVFYPYRHNYVDSEFYFTALKRGVLAECPEAVVAHRHPDWGFSQWDTTYERSRATLDEDARTFQTRVHLWA